MSDGQNPDPRIAQNAAMRALSDRARHTSIEAASNVVGHSRFLERARTVQLERAYKAPSPTGGPRHA